MTMYAIELSGVHIGQPYKITYRFKSWRKSMPDEVVVGTFDSIEHRRNGHVHINKESWGSRYVPFDAVVEILEPKEKK